MTASTPGRARRRSVEGTLGDPALLADRVAALAAPHMGPLNRAVTALRLRHPAVPDFDPADGGVAARLLILLESPGPGTTALRFVSRDNPTGTGANLRRFLAEAGIARHDTVIWNAVPWIIHAPGARNRTPNRAEIAEGLEELPRMLDCLPALMAVVLAGRVAALAGPEIARRRPDLGVFAMPHPSPTIVCTSPSIPARIRLALSSAAERLGRKQDGRPEGRP